MIKIFNVIFILIYICNMAEIMGNRLEQKNKKKEQIGIELVQIMIVSAYTLYLITKGAF